MLAQINWGYFFKYTLKSEGFKQKCRENIINQICEMTKGFQLEAKTISDKSFLEKNKYRSINRRLK